MSNIELSVLSSKYGYNLDQILEEVKRGFSFYVEDTKDNIKNPELADQLMQSTVDQLEITEHELYMHTGYLDLDITAEGYRGTDYTKTVNFRYAPPEPILYISCEETHHVERICKTISLSYGFGALVLANTVEEDQTNVCDAIAKKYCENYFYKLNMNMDGYRINEIYFEDDKNSRYREYHDYCQIKLHLPGINGEAITYVVGYILPKRGGYQFAYVHNAFPLCRERRSLIASKIISFIVAPITSLTSFSSFAAIETNPSFIAGVGFLMLLVIANIGILITSCIVRNVKMKIFLKFFVIALSVLIFILTFVILIGAEMSKMF